MNSPPESDDPIAPVDERPWVAALQRGDERAFERLVVENGPRMLAVALRLLRDEEEAREALQSAFVLAFRGIGKFSGGSRLSTWLHRIVVNAALMRLRARRSRPEEAAASKLSIDELLPAFGADGHSTREFVDWGDLPDAALEQEETRNRVRRAIDRLPDAYRNVLLLRDIEELDTGEVATLLGVTPNAVKIRLHRARQALRELLDRDFRGETS